MLHYLNILIHRLYVRIVLRRVPVSYRPINRQRQLLAFITRNIPAAKEVDIRSIKIPTTDGVDITGEWIKPNGSAPNHVLLYFHGGGFIAGSTNTHRAMVSHIAKTAGIQALSINYRLAPEHTYPIANQDCLQAYQWLLEQGYPPQNISLGGDSAGGFFVLQTLLAIKDKKLPQPQSAVLLSPLTDALHFDGPTYDSKKNIDPWLQAAEIPRLAALYLGMSENKPPSLSPINMDLAQLPPILIHVGEDEILLSDSTRLYQQLEKYGVNAEIEIWPKMWHVFQSMGGRLPQAKLAIKKLGQFIKRQHQY
ncbi:hypothetical protein A9Q99_11360 [Gammaproteobacteria bacterium 45_16_T64]|nr:hypothetical protein A9Q99_11360 [Gammaproteobacteria bacterium 45_16_T64]